LLAPDWDAPAAAANVLPEINGALAGPEFTSNTLGARENRCVMAE
jgi:hypothetical protein